MITPSGLLRSCACHPYRPGLRREQVMTTSPSSGRTTEELIEIIQKVLKHLPEDYQISATDRLEDLNVTSLQLIQIVVAVERKFDIDFLDAILFSELFEPITTLAAALDSLIGG
jgi:acyl carrier protein